MSLIVCSWAMKLPEGHFSVWPDGCRDLIAIIPRDRAATVVCSGLDSAPRQVVCDDDTLFVGVRLAAGVAFPWEEHDPCSRHDDQVVSPTPFTDFHGWDLETDYDEALHELVNVVNDFASPPPSWVPECIEELRRGDVRRLMSLSKRSIRRKLADATGAPPRYWRSLARVRQAALEAVRSEAPLVAVAANNGFSDQAHMSREIRRWLGATPMMLRNHREQAVERLSAPDVFRRV